MYPLGKNRDSGISIRRGFYLRAYVGPNGGGKSLAAVTDLAPSLAGMPWECANLSHRHMAPLAQHLAGCVTCDQPRGFDASEIVVFCEVARETVLPLCRFSGFREVWSTTRLFDPVTGAVNPHYRELGDYRDIVGLEHADLLLDEVTGVASSRQSSDMPPQVANFLVQCRRRDVTVSWTAPSWARADRIIRECTQSVTFCLGYMPDRKSDGLWRPRRLFLWRTYNAMVFDEWTSHKRETLRAEVRQWYWRPAHLDQYAYETLGQVTTLGWPSEAGMCLGCGGKRAHARCTCEREPVMAPLSARGTQPREAREVRAPIAPPLPLSSHVHDHDHDSPLDVVEGPTFP